MLTGPQSRESYPKARYVRGHAAQDKAQLVLGGCVKELTVRLGAAVTELRQLSDAELEEERVREQEREDAGEQPFDPVGAWGRNQNTYQLCAVTGWQHGSTPWLLRADEAPIT